MYPSTVLTKSRESRIELLIGSGLDIGFVCRAGIDEENIMTCRKVVVGNELQP
jgi:hypothetical protein